MADQEDCKLFLDILQTGSEQLLILVESADSETGWRLLSRYDVDNLRQFLIEKKNAPDAPLSPLCYNVKQAAKLVGVSEHKFGEWLKRSDHPVPHFQDGRRIFIPGDMLAEWVKEEAKRSLGGLET